MTCIAEHHCARLKQPAQAFDKVTISHQRTNYDAATSTMHRPERYCITEYAVLTEYSNFAYIKKHRFHSGGWSCIFFLQDTETNITVWLVARNERDLDSFDTRYGKGHISSKIVRALYDVLVITP